MSSHSPEALQELAQVFRQMAAASTIPANQFCLLEQAEKFEAQARQSRAAIRKISARVQSHNSEGKIMSDDEANRGSPDRDRINVDEPYEVQTWSKKFSVTHQELIEAVQIVGDRAEDVERHLKRA